MSLLEIRDLSVFHGDIAAVRNVSFTVEKGDAFVLLGANGAGKTSLLRCISGLSPPTGGEIISSGVNLVGKRPHQVAACGIAHVPEGRRIFPNLSVERNLSVSYIPSRTTKSFSELKDECFRLFPRLAERARQLAGTMSGGEQQMLAISRALMNSPSLLMLDEPSLGLSPLMTELVFERLAHVRNSGMALLLVEQNASALDIASRGLVLSNGEIALSGDSDFLKQSDFVREAYLGA